MPEYPQESVLRGGHVPGSGLRDPGSPESVWPWLVQMGSGRAGWYSYDWIDNDGHPSATEIIPEFQRIAPGDVLPSLPGATDSFIVGPGDDKKSKLRGPSRRRPATS
jgi:hypothetical protein